MKFITKTVKLENDKNVSFILDFTDNVKNIGVYKIEGNTTSYTPNKVKSISGTTTSRLSEVECYDKISKYKVGVNGVTQVTNDKVTYIINSITYTTDLTTNKTTFNYVNNYESYDSGGNLTTNDDLIGLIDEPNTVNKINVNKQFTSGIDSILRILNLKSISEIEDYGIKFFNLNKQ